MENELSTTLKPLIKTMQIHQINVPRRGTILHGHLSCLSALPASCLCFKPDSYSFTTQIEAVISSSVDRGEEFNIESTIQERRRVVKVVESLVSKYCVEKYDGKAYPRVILSIDDEEEFEIKTTHRVGRNRFFWQMIDDVLLYPKESVFKVPSNPPRPVTKRHVEIEPEV